MNPLGKLVEFFDHPSKRWLPIKQIEIRIVDACPIEAFSVVHVGIDGLSGADNDVKLTAREFVDRQSFLKAVRKKTGITLRVKSDEDFERLLEIINEQWSPR